MRPALHPSFPSASNRMKQICVNWRSSVVHDEDDEHRDDGLWVPETPAARREAQMICEVQNAIYGHGSHWIEEREALLLRSA